MESLTAMKAAIRLTMVAVVVLSNGPTSWMGPGEAGLVIVGGGEVAPWRVVCG